MRGDSLTLKNISEGVYFCKYDGTLFLIRMMHITRWHKAIKKLLAIFKEEKPLIDILNIEPENLNSELYKQTVRSLPSRLGSGKRAEAMMLADSIRGMSVSEIMKNKYPDSKYGKRKYSRASVYKAISYKNELDAERIDNLISTFPDIFKDLTKSQMSEWVERRGIEYESDK